jgi:(2R)-sulfolactate sulfo-lyase subunit alpha
LVHEKKDTVGVVVVEGLKAGTDMLAVITHDNSDFRITAKQDIPIGHKVALKDIKKGETVWKYGQDIGVAKAAIGKGEHAHVHNIKTKRW